MPENFDERFDDDEKDFFDRNGIDSNGEEMVENLKGLIMEGTHIFMDTVKLLEDSNFYENDDKIIRELLLLDTMNQLKNIVNRISTGIHLLMATMSFYDSITPEYMDQMRNLLCEEIKILEKISDKIDDIIELP